MNDAANTAEVTTTGPLLKTCVPVMGIYKLIVTYDLEANGPCKVVSRAFEMRCEPNP